LPLVPLELEEALNRPKVSLIKCLVWPKGIKICSPSLRGQLGMTRLKQRLMKMSRFRCRYSRNTPRLLS
jgi:hypothetical protein